MAIHPHGVHSCRCPSCGYETEVEESVKCNTLTCPQCGSRMRAVDTGEYRISNGEPPPPCRNLCIPCFIVGALAGAIVAQATKK